MAYLIGTILAAATLLFVRLVGMDRDRALVPLMLIVIASYYELFAAIGGRVAALRAEAVPVAVFTAAAVAGFRRNLWFAVGGIAAHGVFDAVHAQLIVNPGVPGWWPAFCLSYDLAAAALLAASLRGGRADSRSASPDTA